VTAQFCRQCSARALLCGGVVTAWLAGCLGPAGPVRRGVVGLEPRNLESDREGEEEIGLLCLRGAWDLQGLIMRGEGANT